jgi:hypothetical protein
MTPSDDKSDTYGRLARGERRGSSCLNGESPRRLLLVLCPNPAIILGRVYT